MIEVRRRQISGIYIINYQLPRILTALLHVADKSCLSHGMCLYQVTLYDDVALFE